MKKLETKKIWVVWGIVISFLTGCNLASSGITPAIVSPASATPVLIIPSSTPNPTNDPTQLTLEATETQNYLTPISEVTQPPPLLSPTPTLMLWMIGQYEAQQVLILPPGHQVKQIFSPQDQSIWIKTDSVMWRFGEINGEMTTLDIPGDVILVEGGVWYFDEISRQVSGWGQDGLLAFFNLSETGLNSPAEDSFSSNIFSISKTTDQMWIGQCTWIGPGPLPQEGGVRWFDYDQLTWLGGESPVARGCATRMVEDVHGDMWIGLNDTLWKYNPTTEHWTSFPPPAPPEGTARFGFFTQLAISPAGDVWAALSMCGGASCMTGDALYRLVEGQWQQVGGISDFSSAQFFFTSDGNTWLFQGNTLFRVSGNELVIETTYPGQVVRSDDETRIWLTLEQDGQSGLYVIAP